MLEKDMYKNLKTYLEKLGYTVKAEVLNTDITAVKDDFVVVIEMKKTLNTTLMYQGSQRQKVCDYVYLAILRPTTKQLRSSQFKEKLHLVKRLQLGIIFVDINNDTSETFLDPKNYTLRKNKIKKRKLIKEFKQRRTAFNLGGVTKTKIITAYRESAILIAYYLKDGMLPLKEVKKLTKDYKTASILQKDYYHWFDRVNRGFYQLSDTGISALKEYSYVIDELINN